MSSGGRVQRAIGRSRTSTREAASLSSAGVTMSPTPGQPAGRARGRIWWPVAMRILVLTTSYPRDADDVAGTFVATASRRCGTPGSRCASSRLRASATTGSPTATGSSTTFGAGRGRRSRCRSSSSRSRARRGGRRGNADVVHAHWLPSVLPAMATGKPVVLQLWGSDVALAQRMPPLARRMLAARARRRLRVDRARRRGPRARRATTCG